MSNTVNSIGIIGAGKVGIVLAQLAIKAGYTIYIAGSGDPQKIALTISVLVPGAIAMTSKEVAVNADLVILAIPLGRYKELPKEALKDKVVIDAMNFWWEIDGERPDLTDPKVSSSEVVQQFLSDSKVIKAFNHIGYHDLLDEARPEGSQGRKAIAIAGDDRVDLDIVAATVNSLGFDPVVIGALSEGIKLQPGSPVFGAHINEDTLRETISTLRISI